MNPRVTNAVPATQEDGALRIIPVSYTHLDVYKRQPVHYVLRCDDFQGKARQRQGYRAAAHSRRYHCVFIRHVVSLRRGFMLVSVVIPCYYSEKMIGTVVDQTRAELVKAGYEYEFILVNDGSTDVYKRQGYR